MLSLILPGGRIAEIGVFAGDFAQQILDECRPTELVLFDLWPDTVVCSGDVDGNNVQYHPGPELEARVRRRFAHTPGVTIVKGCSSELSTWPSDSFDALYIDGDHSYRGVRRDLINGWRVVKDGGWLMGHDFENNPLKTKAVYDFGVKQAVLDFCRDHDTVVHALGMDGCVSFAIQVGTKTRLGFARNLLRRTVTDVRDCARHARRALARRFGF